MNYMESSNKNLFDHYCEIIELSITQQKQYINALKNHQPELANKLGALVNSNSDLTQVFTDSILDFTDENQLASVGDRLANYQLIQTLGKGGMGQVFKAERCDGKIEQTVAIKFLHPLFYQYQSGKLLLQEAQALAQLNHPNIAAIYDVAETDNGNAYIIMEYIEGVTLDVYLQQNCLSVDNKLSLFNQIADAVLEAHNQQIIHADIKPSNVLITASGQAKLIDFGVMQLTGELTKTAPKLVTHYLCAMTVNYASPEQLNGEKSTVSSDIYGLGGLLYFMLSGKSPFEEVGGTLTSKVQHITNKVPDNCVVTDNVTFKSDLIGIIQKVLAKKPKERYRTVTDLMNDIQAYQQSKVISVSSAYRFHNAVKFFYRNRIINTAIACVFIILFVAVIQINNKNLQIIKEKNSLVNVSEELKRTYSLRDKSLADADDETPPYLPDPSKLEPENYVELMLLMFDGYYRESNYVVCRQIISILASWTEKNKLASELTEILIAVRLFIIEEQPLLTNKKVEAEFDRFYNKIYKLESFLDERVIELFLFISRKEYSKGEYFPKIIDRLERELPEESISVRNRFQLYLTKAKILNEKDQNYNLSIEYYERAYKLAKMNPKEIPLLKVTDLISHLGEVYNDQYGPNHHRSLQLTEDLQAFLSHISPRSVAYYDILGTILQKLNKYSMAEVEKIILGNDFSLKYLNSSLSKKKVHSYRFYSFYLSAKGEYSEAEVIVRKLVDITSNQSGKNNKYYIYLLEGLISNLLQQGKYEEALLYITNEVIPYAKNHLSLDYLGFYQSIFCSKIAMSGYQKSLDKLCFNGYLNTVNELGKDNYWSKFALKGIVAYFTTKELVDDESIYVNELEQSLIGLPSKQVLAHSTVLFNYFVSRNNLTKAEKYLNLSEKALEQFYDSMDTIKRDYHQIMAAELDILKGDDLNAISKLNKVHKKVCSLGDKVPQKVKYLKLQNSLNQHFCRA